MVYVFLADGFETIEALAVVDMLRRAKIDNLTVGVTGKTVKSSHNIEVVADITIDELNISNADAIVLPGGMPGTLNLEANGVVQSSIDYSLFKWVVYQLKRKNIFVLFVPHLQFSVIRVC